MAPGGMGAIWKIEPDLACYGKAAANGLPLTILAGRRRFMDAVAHIHYGLTHESEAISAAAAVATMSEILDRDVCRALAQKGARLKDTCVREAVANGVAAALTGADARPMLECDHQGGLSADAMRWLLIQELARDGVYTLGAFNLCFSHTDRDIERIEASIRRAIGVLRTALDRGSVEGLLDAQIHGGLTA
jgi:glutamate-1-semialdehyde 2,1-aminomutase